MEEKFELVSNNVPTTGQISQYPQVASPAKEGQIRDLLQCNKGGHSRIDMV